MTLLVVVLGVLLAIALLLAINWYSQYRAAMRAVWERSADCRLYHSRISRLREQVDDVADALEVLEGLGSYVNATRKAARERLEEDNGH